MPDANDTEIGVETGLATPLWHGYADCMGRTLGRAVMMVTRGIRSTIPACALLLGVFMAPWAAAEVIQAYPAVYELSRMTDDGERVIAGGDVLLQQNRRVDVSDTPGDDEDAPRVSLSFTTERADQAERRLAVTISAEIAFREGDRRISAGDQNDSFIAGPDMRRVTFETRRWQTMDDPVPLRVRHEDNGETYVLTLMFDEDALR